MISQCIRGHTPHGSKKGGVDSVCRCVSASKLGVRCALRNDSTRRDEKRRYKDTRAKDTRTKTHTRKATSLELCVWCVGAVLLAQVSGRTHEHVVQDVNLVAVARLLQAQQLEVLLQQVHGLQRQSPGQPRET